MIKLEIFNSPKTVRNFFSTNTLTFFVIFLLVMWLGLNPVQAYESSALVSDVPNTESMPENVKEGFGCFIAGSLATAITAAIGAENLVNVVAGGVVAPASTAVLAFGVVGVVFSSFCVIGQVLTPTTVYIYNNM